MAGGEFAQEIPCMLCGSRAERTYEGDENDHYHCEREHEFSMKWGDEQPTEPQWPPSPEMEAFFAKQRAEESS